jgi:hypothetical protein
MCNYSLAILISANLCPQATLETCDVCGEVLTGAFFKMDGKNVCEKDYKVGASCINNIYSWCFSYIE